MTLQPTDPIPDKDLAKQFDMAHLPGSGPSMKNC